MGEGLKRARKAALATRRKRESAAALKMRLAAARESLERAVAEAVNRPQSDVPPCDCGAELGHGYNCSYQRYVAHEVKE
jgi:hypothetical protein